MKLYFIRHGESEANVCNEFADRPSSRHGLTAKGRRQVSTLARRIHEVKITKIFSSPLLRAIQTAEILSTQFQTPYEINNALCEYDCGILEGKSDAASWKVYEKVLYQWMMLEQWNERIEGGESFNEIMSRFVPFIQKVTQDYRQQDVNVALVGHGGIFRCMLPRILVNVTPQFALEHPLGNAGHVVALVRAEDLVCVEWYTDVEAGSVL